jgi:hypothetical protein
MEMVNGLFPIPKKRRTQQAGLLSGGEQQMLAVGRALVLRWPPPYPTPARSSIQRDPLAARSMGINSPIYKSGDVRRHVRVIRRHAATYIVAVTARVKK